MKNARVKKLNAFDRMLHKLVDKFVKNERKIKAYCFWAIAISLMVLIMTYLVYVRADRASSMELVVTIVNWAAIAGLGSVFAIGLFRPFVMAYGAITGK